MATDNKATQNQKVFITLASVVELTAEYNRTCAELERRRATPNGNPDMWAARKAAFEYVIEHMGLPIPQKK